jgi:hypothetical protein
MGGGGVGASRKGGEGLCQAVAEFLVPDWGDKVNCGIGLSYRPSRLQRLAGRNDSPVQELTISPSQRL